MVKRQLFLFSFFFFSISYTQNYIDEQQNRIDALDGIIDTFYQNEILTKYFFNDIDSIQYFLKSTSQLSNVEKENVKQLIYAHLYHINKQTLQHTFIKPDLFKNLLTFLKFESKDKGKIALETKPSIAFQILPYITSFESTKSFLLETATLMPSEVFRNFSAFAASPYANKVLHIAAYNDPVAVIKYLSTNHPINDALHHSKYKSDSLLLYVYKTTGRTSKSYLLIDEIAHGKLSALEAEELTREANQEYFYRIINLLKKDSLQGRESIDNEMRYHCIHIIRPINAQYEAHDSKKRFESLKKYNSKELYTIIVYSEDEIFTSSFTGAFEILLNTLKNEEKNTFQLIEDVGFNKFRTFLKMCAGYGKLVPFLEQMNPNEKEILLSKFATLDNESYLLKEAVSIADAVGSIVDSVSINIIENVLLKNYFNSKRNENETLSYGLLISLFKDKAIEHSDTFTIISKKYKINTLSKLDKKALFGKDSIHTQTHYFYDDDDGISSFNSFKNKFNSNSWKLKDKGQFIIIENIKGEKIQLLANKPVYERSAPPEMKNYLNENQRDIEVLVHRGHSFYVDNSLKHLQPEMILVILGSCGGYHQVLDILNQAPQAQIIATKQIGSYTVNDPLIYKMLNIIKKREEIDWIPFWKELGESFPKNSYAYDKFIEYVPPYQNLGAGFIQAYRKYQFNY